jgi:hypothetical protein
VILDCWLVPFCDFVIGFEVERVARFLVSERSFTFLGIYHKLNKEVKANNCGSSTALLEEKTSIKEKDL